MNGFYAPFYKISLIFLKPHLCYHYICEQKKYLINTEDKMKILSKYKDYYDYLIHKYGIDEKVVYDRRDGFVPKDAKSWRGIQPVKVAICGLLYTGLCDKDGNFYWGDDRLKVAEKKDIEWNFYKDKLFYKSPYNNLKEEYIDEFETETDVNDKNNCPVVFVSGFWNQNHSNSPCLETLGFASFMDAEELYLKIYNWISKRNEPDTTDTRDDKTKIVNAGFDTKISFRHRKNKK